MFDAVLEGKFSTPSSVMLDEIETLTMVDATIHPHVARTYQFNLSLADVPEKRKLHGNSSPIDKDLYTRKRSRDTGGIIYG
jgi:hypothetical protein